MKRSICGTVARRVLCAILVLTADTGLAGEYTVNSAAAFNTAQVSAVAGDVIIWEDGTYTNVSFSIDRSGITVRAATPAE